MGTGIIRRVDELGRIVLPKDIRRQLNIREGDPMEIEVVSSGVLLRKYCPDEKVRTELQTLDALVEIESNLSRETTRQLREHIAQMLQILKND